MACSRRRRLFATVVTCIGVAVALLSAWSMLDRVRAVDVITLFFGGFAAGVGAVKWIAGRGANPDREAG